MIFFNILTFLHCCDPAEYILRGQPGYDPRLKFGNVLPLMLDQFKSVWVPRREISIDEGMISFKGKFITQINPINTVSKHTTYATQQMVTVTCLMFTYVAITKVHQNFGKHLT